MNPEETLLNEDGKDWNVEEQKEEDFINTQYEPDTI
jgi:hypothetical protein